MVPIPGASVNGGAGFLHHARPLIALGALESSELLR